MTQQILKKQVLAFSMGQVITSVGLAEYSINRILLLAYHNMMKLGGTFGGSFWNYLCVYINCVIEYNKQSGSELKTFTKAQLWD